MPGISLEIRRKCKICGKVFLVKKLDSQYCSGKCSKIAYKRKCDAEKKEERLAKMASQVPNIKEYISVKEAAAIFGVERDSVYRFRKALAYTFIYLCALAIVVCLSLYQSVVMDLDRTNRIFYHSVIRNEQRAKDYHALDSLIHSNSFFKTYRTLDK